MRIFISTVLLIIASHLSLGQRTLLLDFNMDYGLPMNSYQQNRSMLSSKLSSFNLQGGVSLTARFWQRIGLNVGIAQNYQYWTMKDKAFEQRHPGYKVHLKNNNFFPACFVNLQLLQQISNNSFFYIQGGYGINLVGARSLTQTKIFVLGGETITANSRYYNQNTFITGEIGIQKFIKDKHMFSFAIKYNQGQSTILNGTYTADNGTSTPYKDTYKSNGSSLGISLKYSFVLAHHDKKQKAPKEHKEHHPKEEPVIVKHQEVKKDTIHHQPIDTTVTKKPVADTTTPKKLEGRDIKVTHKISVQSKTVTIKVWDHEQVDGDRISLNLNGRWILINYTLQKTPKVIQVELDDTKPNFLVLHALNLGKYPPNTAAIIIDDGVKANQIILESTLETSGTMEITVGQ